MGTIVWCKVARSSVSGSPAPNNAPGVHEFKEVMDDAGAPPPVLIDGDSSHAVVLAGRRHLLRRQRDDAGAETQGSDSSAIGEERIRHHIRIFTFARAGRQMKSAASDFASLRVGMHDRP